MSKSKKTRRKEAPPQKTSNKPIIDSYIVRARQLHKGGELEHAITVIRQAAKLAPKNAALQHEVASWLAEKRDRKEAIAFYDKALDADPNFIPSLVQLAQMYSQSNELDKAAPLIQTALDNNDKIPSVHLVYGSILQKQGQLEESVAHFRTALQLRLDGNLPIQPPQPKKKDFGGSETEALLWETLSVLAKAGVHAFPCFGTLLGLVREGTLLSFDKDVDLGAPFSEIHRATRCLESHGWLKVQMKGMTNPVSFYHPGTKLTVDLSGFVVDQSDGATYEGVWLESIPWEWARLTRFPPMELKKDTSPDGRPIWMLKDPEPWLEALYSDWKTPDPNFDTIICAHNLCGFALLTQCYAFSRIYSKWEKNQLTKAIALCKHTLKHLPDDTLIREVLGNLETASANGPQKVQLSAAQTPLTLPSTPPTTSGVDASFAAGFAPQSTKLDFNS